MDQVCHDCKSDKYLRLAEVMGQSDDVINCNRRHLNRDI